jgi:hypothetical protein
MILEKGFWLLSRFEAKEVTRHLKLNKFAEEFFLIGTVGFISAAHHTKRRMVYIGLNP